MFINCLWPFKFQSEIFPKRSHKICSHFAMIETVKGVKAPFTVFRKRKLLVPRNTKTNNKPNGLITLPLNLWCQNKTQTITNFHLYIIQQWQIFAISFVHGYVVNSQTWEVSPPKKKFSRASLKTTTSNSHPKCGRQRDTFVHDTVTKVILFCLRLHLLYTSTDMKTL